MDKWILNMLFVSSLLKVDYAQGHGFEYMYIVDLG